MDSHHYEWRDHNESRGVNRTDAEEVVNNCAGAMAKQAAARYLAGGPLVCFIIPNPAFAVGYGTIAVGADNVLLNSNECARVRQTINFLSTTTD